MQNHILYLKFKVPNEKKKEKKKRKENIIKQKPE